MAHLRVRRSHQCYEDFAKATDAHRKHCKTNVKPHQIKNKWFPDNDCATIHTQRQTHSLICKSGMLGVCMYVCPTCVSPGSFFMWQYRNVSVLRGSCTPLPPPPLCKTSLFTSWQPCLSCGWWEFQKMMQSSQHSSMESWKHHHAKKNFTHSHTTLSPSLYESVHSLLGNTCFVHVCSSEYYL